MLNDSIQYYDGTSTRPSLVRVLVFHNQVHLYPEHDENISEAFPFAHTSINQIGNRVHLYLDQAGLKYLQYPADHPLASVLAAEVAKNKGNWAQKLLKQQAIVLVALVVMLGVGLYLATVNLIPLIGTRLIGVEQEIKIGDKLKDITLKEAPVFGRNIDTKASKNLQEFCDKLQLSSTYSIRLTVVNSDIVNAYALPGGNIVVYKGILKRIKTPEELVGLLAHETTHVNQRHSLRSMLRSAANGIIVSIVFGDASGISGAIVTNAETLNGLRYSRSLETEADEKGMDLMLANKVDVSGMQQLMKMLQQEEKLPESLGFFSTHPMTKERIAAAEKYARKHQQRFSPRADLASTFSKLKDQLR